MQFTLEIIKFIIYSALIVLISKYILVTTLRKLAESLNLKAKTVGAVAGYATSVPELLTISVSSFKGLMGASIYNVISSNVINLVQYIFAILLNKNGKMLKNKTIELNIALSIITIIIPLLMVKFGIDLNLQVIPAFILLYVFFAFLNNTVHNKYANEKERMQDKENTNNIKDYKKTFLYVFNLILTGVVLFFIGNALGNTIESLCLFFNMPEFIVGILLGFITSLPELITFLEAQKHHKEKENNIAGVLEATNNLLTSNMLNLFIIQSVGIIIFSFI